MTDEAAIRRELGEVMDRLAELPADAFAERAELLTRQQELRASLRAIEIPGADETRARWSEQAGSKPPEDEGTPVIPSPLEGGSSV